MLVLALGDCRQSDSATSGSAATNATEGTAGARLVDDVVPHATSAADVGCVDEAGALGASAAEWYPDEAPGLLFLGGQSPADVADGLAEFHDAIVQAVGHALGDSEVIAATEYDAFGSSCVTHRSVTLEVGSSDIVVTLWRPVHAAARSWVASERSFAVVDVSTLVSGGVSLRVALVVGRNGTTVRASAYGPGAREAFSGRPTTIATVPGAPAPGPTTTSTGDLAGIGAAVLDDVLARR